MPGQGGASEKLDVASLEHELETAISSALLGLELPITVDERLTHLMSKAAVTVLESAEHVSRYETE